ncbi:hypothetical protein GDO81_023147 [Engystomops pustulosus]|uniref:Uncharacterized protein n=1 Tax=Engystomops pustulosus TaxID=76066 RepID=A0AAV6Z6Q5_ENGPU|nr:hypothetical protein GDO81_023147 [Engystomops pustulosus]
MRASAAHQHVLNPPPHIYHPPVTTRGLYCFLKGHFIWTPLLKPLPHPQATEENKFLQNGHQKVQNVQICASTSSSSFLP